MNNEWVQLFSHIARIPLDQFYLLTFTYHLYENTCSRETDLYEGNRTQLKKV